MEAGGMVMTRAEICADYRQAAQKSKQISILADLNQCDRKQIVEILREGGEPLPGYYSTGKKEGRPASSGGAERSGDRSLRQEDRDAGASDRGIATAAEPPRNDSGTGGIATAEPMQALAQVALKAIRRAMDDTSAMTAMSKIDGILSLYEAAEEEMKHEGDL